jgi:hypothetical protein
VWRTSLERASNFRELTTVSHFARPGMLIEIQDVALIGG